MARLIPERPLYRKEYLIVGYPTLVLFILLFVCRLLDGRVLFSFDTLGWRFLLELLIFGVPTLGFLLVRGKGYTRMLRLRPTAGKQFLLLPIAFCVLFSGCMLLSILFGGIETLRNSAVVFEENTPTGWVNGLLQAFVLAILPAVAEEFFFRGIVLAEYERRGAVRAVLMSALLFSLVHFDLHNLLVYFFAGLLFATVLFITDSLFAVMFLHALYNLLMLFAGRYLNALYEFTGSVELFLFFLVTMFLLSAFFFCRGAAKLYRAWDAAGVKDPHRAVPWNVQFYTILDAGADPATLACVLLSIVAFILL